MSVRDRERERKSAGPFNRMELEDVFREGVILRTEDK